MTPDAAEIVRWLQENCPQQNVRAAITETAALIDDGLIDSMQIMLLVSYLEDRTGISIPLGEVVPDNFETPRAVAAMIARLGRGPSQVDQRGA